MWNWKDWKYANIQNFLDYGIELSIFDFCLWLLTMLDFFLSQTKEMWFFFCVCVSVCLCVDVPCIYAHAHKKTTQTCTEIRDKICYAVFQLLSISLFETESLFPGAYKLRRLTGHPDPDICLSNLLVLKLQICFIIHRFCLVTNSIYVFIHFLTATVMT